MRYEDCVKQGKTYVIAEMSGNHGGDLNKALDIVYAACKAGADCLKTQTYTADTMTLNCNREDFIVKGGLWNGRKLYDLYNDGHTPWKWQKVIKDTCDELGMEFMSSPFDKTSVDFLESIGCNYYKIASPELIDIPLIKYVANTGKTMFVSTGMANKEEIEESVKIIRRYNKEKFVLLKCCSQYPSDFENMNLMSIPLIRDTFNCNVGFSDHSLGFMCDIVAVSLGANVIEKHLCISRKDNVVDSKFSMEPDEFKEMVDRIHDVEVIKGIACMKPSEGEKRGLNNRRSLYVSKDIKKGELFTDNNVRSIRPGKGLSPKFYNNVIGKIAACDISFGTPLVWELVERQE